MTGSKKKTKEQISLESENKQETFGVFADVLLENVVEEEHRHDPLEAYIGKLRIHFYADTHIFSERFQSGYDTIINELKN